jgi:tRNA threonylcarbamoyladenosine biosynthesis protein TsaB
MLILALDGALSRCSAAVVADERLVAARQQDTTRGQAALLAPFADVVLAEARVTAAELDLIAVTVGPGSFTGIRAALALAHGLGLGTGRPVIGVTVGEALASALPALGTRTLWVAIDSRRERVFLARGNEPPVAVAREALPEPEGPVAIAGDAAVDIAARLAARGADVMLTDARVPQPRHVALVAARRWKSELPPLPAQPLYVDPPAARLPEAARHPMGQS